MSKAGNALLHVHLDHVQPKSRSQDYAVTSGTVQEPELTLKMLGKCSFQDCWLKNSGYQEWVPKDKLDKHYPQYVACKIRFIFLCSLLLRWFLQNLILVLTSPYLALVQVPANHDWGDNRVCWVQQWRVNWCGLIDALIINMHLTFAALLKMKQRWKLMGIFFLSLLVIWATSSFSVSISVYVYDNVFLVVLIMSKLYGSWITNTHKSQGIYAV